MLARAVATVLNDETHPIPIQGTVKIAQTMSPATPFVLGNKFRATLATGAYDCKLLEIKGAWLKCEIPAADPAQKPGTMWLNSYTILTLGTP